jgi:hypothetical protein
VLLVGDGLKVGLDASFDNMKNWKRIWEKAKEVNSTNAYIQMIRRPSEFIAGVTVVPLEGLSPRRGERA